jgi:NAD(P)-dependent dehydrogenase (short-subunit alcohol dehydrogenase family)
MTDLRGLQSLGNDDRSQFADLAIAERLRAANPLHMALTPGEIAGACVFLASRGSAAGITGTIVTVEVEPAHAAAAVIGRGRCTPTWTRWSTPSAAR